MPTANPSNRALNQPFPNPEYQGMEALEDLMTGQVRSPGDDPDIVLLYSRLYERLKCVTYTKAPGSPDLNVDGYIVPCFSDYWSEFRSTLGAPSYGATTRNKAYSRFKNKVVGDSSQLGVFAAERREAYGMIAKRAVGLFRAAKALRRGRFRTFLNELSVSPKRKHRNKIRNATSEAAGLWLEYWFGWSPTVAEMHGILDSLTKELPHQRFSGSAKLDLFSKVVQSGRERTHRCTYRVRTGATVNLTNPNLFLLNSMGLANPLSVLNEVIPFSFAVEWFVKYGEVIDSMTDFIGLSLENPYSSYRLEKSSRTFSFANSIYSVKVESVGKSFGMFRSKSLLRPTVVTVFDLPTVFKSKTRAATAVSLLIGVLNSFRS
jgi:hypothetical protein